MSNERAILKAAQVINRAHRPRTRPYEATTCAVPVGLLSALQEALQLVAESTEGAKLLANADFAQALKRDWK